jgi:3-hydroxybutyryl-CoA dehydrogenase
VLYVTDGRSATQRAAETGIANTVLIDLALDYTKATRLAVAAAEQCEPAAVARPSACCRPPALPCRASDVPGWP